MSGAFDGLAPLYVWKNFEALTKVPRPSKHEEKVIEYMYAWAKSHGFAVKSDEIKNLVIFVPATQGFEKHPTVVLQGHLDMVCEKNNDVDFDFMTQPLNVYRDGDWIKAKGTTLGADNGIGLAMAMALAEDPDAKHPALEILCTVDEETGLTGAFNLSSNLLTGKILLNIDSEEEGTIFVGCAGGGDSETVLPLHLSPIPANYEVLKCTVKGLIGGHSGLTIHENRGNAIKFLAQWVHEVIKTHDLHICNFHGGDKHNAIPREASLVVAGPAGTQQALAKALATYEGLFGAEYGKLESTMELLAEAGQAQSGLDVTDSKRLLHVIIALPHGVETMSRDIEGLVETSSNLARVRWEDNVVKILNSSRSSVAAGIVKMREKIHSVAELAGGEAVHKEGYPGWQPNMDSKLLALARKVHLGLTGKEPVVTAIHAGLECGIIGEKYPGMDMISLGPTMHNVHSPDEKLSISSTERVYGFLKLLVAAV